MYSVLILSYDEETSRYEPLLVFSIRAFLFIPVLVYFKLNSFFLSFLLELQSLTLHYYNAGLQHFVIFAAQPSGLPLDEVTIANYLKSEGYKTHAVGKVSLSS